MHPLQTAPDQIRFKAGYIDGVSLGDNWKTVLNDLILFKKECSDIGLLLNEKKWELTVIGSDDSEHDSIVDSFRKVCPNISLLPLSEL